GVFQTWELSSGRPVSTGLGGMPLTALAYSPDGRFLAAGGYDNLVRLWNRLGKIATLAGHTNTVHALAFSPDGKILASAGADGRVKLWRVGRYLQANVVRQIAPVDALAFSGDGKLFYTAGGTGRYTDDNTPGQLLGWDSVSGQLVSTLQEPTSCERLAISPDGKTLAVAIGKGLGGGSPGVIEIWNLDTRKPTH